MCYPKAMPIFDARPRVLCDTNVIGDLLALSGGDLRNDFIRLARAGVAFHINAYVLDEICYALIADPQQQAEGVRNSGNLGAVDPRQLAALLAALLDPEIPVFPYQHYLYGLVGFGGTPRSRSPVRLHGSVQATRTTSLRSLSKRRLNSHDGSTRSMAIPRPFAATRS